MKSAEERISLTRSRRESGQASLVALLVAAAIIGVLAWIFLFRGNKAERAAMNDPALVPSSKTTVPGQAFDQAKAVECRNNLDQIRKAIQMDNMTGEEGFPSSLQAVSGIPSSMKSCPLSHRPYAYDPKTGRVYCVTPGHQRL